MTAPAYGSSTQAVNATDATNGAAGTGSLTSDAGDLLICFACCQNDGTSITMVSAGWTAWTEYVSPGSPAMRVRIFTRQSPGETSTYTLSLPPRGVAIVAKYTGVRIASAVHGVHARQDTGGAGGDGSVDALGTTTTWTEERILQFFCGKSSGTPTWSAPGGSSLRSSIGTFGQAQCALTDYEQATIGTAPAKSASTGIVAMAPEAGVTVALIPANRAPSTPDLQSPANGASRNFNNSADRLFEWVHNDVDGDAPAGFAFRRKIGVDPYEYWNATTEAWQAGIVWNTTGSSEHQFPSGSWDNGETYSWSVATKDASGAEGSFASDWVVDSMATPPTINVTAPSGSITTTTAPTVTWTYSDTEGDLQETYRVRVFNEDQYTDGGFDPDSSEAAYDSGTVGSAGVNHVLDEDLPNSINYRAYVRVTEVGGSYSDWDYVAFSINVVPPDPPLVQTFSDPENGRILIVVTGQHETGDYPEVFYTIERSADDGATWTAVRGGTRVAPDAGVVKSLYDYEYVPNKNLKYRAKTIGTA
jgi:hypothetical protein